MRPGTDAAAPQKLPEDSHEAQAQRVAEHLEAHPDGCTGPELYETCDLGCWTKVLSAMTQDMGYGICKGWRHVPCVDGTKLRRLRVYILTHRPAPAAQGDLFIKP